jgi:hypothetical protein
MSRDISLNRILASECCVPTCRREPEEGAPFPICLKHMRQVFRYFDGYAELAKQIVAERIPLDQDEVVRRVREAHDQEFPAKTPNPDKEQVYYVKTGDCIKIGYTVNVRQRMGAMRLPIDAVLATEPGGMQLERMRHKQFAHLRRGRLEDFEPAEDLLSHVAMLREHFGAPRITSWRDT